MKTALIITSLTSLVNGYPNIDSIVDKRVNEFSKKARKVNVKTGKSFVIIMINKLIHKLIICCSLCRWYCY